MINSNDTSVEIAPVFSRSLSAFGLIQSQGSIDFQSNYSSLGYESDSYFFKIKAGDFHFQAGFQSKHLYIQRNGFTLTHPIDPVYEPSDKLHVFISWTTSKLSLQIVDHSYKHVDGKVQIAEVEKRKKELLTPVTIPPNRLLAFARKNSLVPVTTYSSKEDFAASVLAALESIADKVKSLGVVNPFWDKTYKGTKIVSRKPKKEVDIHPTINALLYDLSIVRSLEVVREYPIGGGNLDFLISGILQSGEVDSVCLEFKPAHSLDIFNGLLYQLPQYMKARGCDWGIYVVLYFRDKYFQRPEKYSLDQLKLELEIQKRNAGLKQITVYILDLSHPASPSSA